MPLTPGTRLGSYEVIAPLGSEAGGEVYRAHDATSRREVAIRILRDSASSDSERSSPREREMLAVTSLSHPNILAVHDVGSDNGLHYAVTELLEGDTLRDVLKVGPLAVPDAVNVASQIALGLEAAHARGIVHRDLKPENVFVLHDRHVKIIDLGLAKPEGTRRASSGVVAADLGRSAAAGDTNGDSLHSAGYLSPEQVRGDAVDHRTDIFSLGCVLYELVTGRRPFAGDTQVEIQRATMHEAPDVARLRAFPASLVRVLTRCLEKDPSNRFRSAADVRVALAAMMEEPRASATVPGTSTPGARLPFLVAAALMAVATLLGIAAAVWYAA